MNRFLLLVLLLPLSAIGQIFQPVKWDIKAERLSPTEAEVRFKATIDAGWHIYAQNVPDGGPVATLIEFKELKEAKLSGKTTEPKGHTEFDKAFGITVTFFEKEVTFKQKLKVSAKAAKVTGELTFMVCNDERCLPPDYIPFDLAIPADESKGDAAPATSTPIETESPMGDAPQIYEPVKWQWKLGPVTNGEADLMLEGTVDAGWHYYSTRMPADFPFPTMIKWVADARFTVIDSVREANLITHFDSMFGMSLSFFEGKAVFSQRIHINNDSAFTIKGSIEGVACNNVMCTPPDLREFTIDIPPGQAGRGSNAANADTSWVGIFIAGFIGGLFALLTPCVFPMIPLTVSFFTKQSKTKAQGVRNAVLYGLSIIGIYVMLGFGVTTLFGADALNALSTNVWFNIFFFVLLVVFAISFLGAFEITMPSSWVNKADQASERGGLVGIFFMAFTLSLVSFSCTGPIIGTLLVEAAVNGGVMGPIMGMVGFSSALALPFGLFAAFPGWLNTLPKSGGWLNSVKVVLGLLELALALKFLSNADLVVQAHYITREVFLSIWIAIFGTLALYLFGFIRFPHDSPTQHLSIPRYLFGLTALVFTVYMVPGLWGAPLKIISGFPPPQFYSESPQGLISANTGGVGGSASTHSAVKTGDGHCPHDLPCFHDYETGLAHAKKVGKPVMLDFTGWACVNCRKMEEQVWSDPQVLKRLAEDFVLISLYVDEKTELPKDQQIEVTIGDRQKTLRTIGNKWSHMQTSRFGTNSQPYYLVLDHNEQQIGPPAAYDPDIQKYIEWLDAGKKGFGEQGK